MAETDPQGDVNNAWLVEYRQARAHQSQETHFGGGGRYELSEDQLEAMIKRLEALSEKIEVARYSAEPMREVRPPGEDPYSKQVADVMNESGKKYLDSLISQQHAVVSLIRQMKKALGHYSLAEEDNATAVRQASQKIDNGEL